MAEKAKCPSCQNKRTVECPCCFGWGAVQLTHFSPYSGKIYICVDCAGSGQIPCPLCHPKIETKHPARERLHEIELRFGQA